MLFSPREPRVLFVAAHPENRAPGQRFRYEQYLDYLRGEGIDCELAPLFTDAEEDLFYSRASFFLKVALLSRCALRRARDVFRSQRFDIVYMQREAFFGGWPLFERAFKAAGTRLVLDFDDAIWLLDISSANQKYAWLKRPQKTSEVARMSDLVVAGNNFLADYGRTFNSNVVVIPTTIDTDAYTRTAPRRTEGQVCVGWTGSKTTIRNFESGLPYLREIRKRFGDRIRFRVIGDGAYRNDELNIQGEAWSAAAEVDSLCDMDIGIMPLPNEVWSKGKCGLKGLQFMGLEVPVVMENIGANAEIVRDGTDGFLASGTDEWVTKLSALIESSELRARIGMAGRKRVEERYSVKAYRGKYAQVLRSLFRGERVGERAA